MYNGNILWNAQYNTRYRGMNRQERRITFSFEYAANIKYEKQRFLFLFHQFNMRRLKIHESD